ncbi:hypothetical protein M959_03899 [Chaetura pelagica]|nr:hypothetical protein M959_03899 [Chaetura pelagica]
MTLPTGVSTFLLECLDVDSTADYNAGASDSTNSCSSPETFRDEASEGSNFYPEDAGKYKNSTLLDCSKAVAIDKIPQISNLSAILEPVPRNFQDHYYTRRKRLSNCSYSSSALSVSATVAGKKVCKITAARERTPDLKAGMRCPSPLGPERKPGNQTAKIKGENLNTLEEGASSFHQLDAPGSASAMSAKLTAKVLPSQWPDAVVPLYSRQEICSIVRTSPGQRAARQRRVPAERREFRLPEGVTEDVITCAKNWTCCKNK